MTPWCKAVLGGCVQYVSKIQWAEADPEGSHRLGTAGQAEAPAGDKVFSEPLT